MNPVKNGENVDKKFGIKVISNGCGILPHTLRVWEQRYQVFSPDRSESGQRLYSEDDLRKAKLIAKLLEDGHAISSLARYSIEELAELVSSTEQNSVSSANNFSINTKKLLKHLQDYQIEKVAIELQHLRSIIGAKEFVFGIVLPIMREIGLLVAKGKYTVTQEHIISTIVRDQLAQIYLPNIGVKSKEMALATPEGNLHELSIIIADVLCRANRISTRYLGAAHPAECLGQAMNALKTPYLVLGVVSSDDWNFEDNIMDFLNQIDKHLNRPLQIILGGGYKTDFPKFKMISDVKIIESLEDFDSFLEEMN